MKKSNENVEKFAEDLTLVAQFGQWNFARKGVEEELKDETCSFYVCSRRIATRAMQVTHLEMFTYQNASPPTRVILPGMPGNPPRWVTSPIMQTSSNKNERLY